MARDIDVDLNNQLQSTSLRPRFFMKFEFDGGDIFLWTGLGTYNWNGDDYLGAGNIISISEVEETLEMKAAGIVYELTGVNEALIALALIENFQDRPANLWLAVVGDDDLIIGEPYLLARGKMDTMSVDDDPNNPAIRLTAESILIDLERPRTINYTTEDQKIVFPDDRGFNYVPRLNDGQEIIFGFTGAGSGGGGGGGGGSIPANKVASVGVSSGKTLVSPKLAPSSTGSRTTTTGKTG